MQAQRSACVLSQTAGNGSIMRKSFRLKAPLLASKRGRSGLVVRAESFWDKLKGKLGGGGGDSNDQFRGSESSSRGTSPSSADRGGEGANGIFGHGNTGGRGGGNKWNPGGQPASGGGDGTPIWKRVKDNVWGSWVLVWNMFAFLAVADVLHRTVDWMAKTELLLLVGGQKQALERCMAIYYRFMEFFQRKYLGWDVPGQLRMPAYESIARNYPETHAYAFDQYRYDMTEAEKTTMRRFYGARHFERKGGKRGDVDPKDVRAIEDKFEPNEADRKAYREAKERGTLDTYWTDARKEKYNVMARGGEGLAWKA